MKELKTLKDLEYQQFGRGESLVVLSDELKQEAVKWLKEAKKRKKRISKGAWMFFFNLTEEDLKNDKS